MICAKATLWLPILIVVMFLLCGPASADQPLARDGNRAVIPAASRPAGQPASKPASQPASRAATQPVDEKAVADLIRLLGDNRFKVREEATEKLIAMGPAICPLIVARLQDKTLDPETAIRIKTVLAKVAPLFDSEEAARRQEEAAKSLGVPVHDTIDLGNKVTIQLALIPAGKFMMGPLDSGVDRSGGDGPRHEVKLSKPFHVGVFAVTQEQYELVVGTNPANFKGARNPVEMVSWDDAVEFCKKLSLKTGRTVSLPTEAQWEYACRAGGKSQFSFGDDEEKLGDYAWYAKNSEGKTHPVGQKKPNNWGLYDIQGNVWQWCADWYEPYTEGAKTDPSGPAAGTNRVLRGGSWLFDGSYCRSAVRNSIPPNGRFDRAGFRIVVGLK